jgi:hypothetical protein
MPWVSGYNSTLISPESHVLEVGCVSDIAPSVRDNSKFATMIPIASRPCYNFTKGSHNVRTFPGLPPYFS